MEVLLAIAMAYYYSNEIAMICQIQIEMNVILMTFGFADLRFHVATEKQIIYT